MERSPSAQARSPVPVLFLTVFLDILGFAIVLPLLPQMLEHYVGLERQASWFGRLVDGLAAASGSSAPENVEAMFGAVLMGIYSALQFLFAPFWGALSDRVGRRPVLLVTVWGIAASYLLWLFSGSFLLLVAARLLGGVMSGNIATATAAVADATTPEDRPKGMGMIGAAIGLGFTLGPALGALLGSRRLDLAAAFPDLQRFGVNPFSTAAAGSFLLAAANWVWLWARFAETLRPEDRGTAREARRTIDPVRMFRRVEHPGVNLAFWSYFLYFVALSGMESTLTFLTKERLGFTPGKNGILFLYFGLILVVVQGGLIRQLAPAYGPKRLAVAGLLFLIPGFALLAFAGRVGQLYLAMAFVGFGSAFITPSLSSLVSLYTPPTEQGRVLGVFRSLGALARATGPFAAGFLYWRFGSASPYLAAAALALAPLLLALRLPRPPAGGGQAGGP